MRKHNPIIIILTFFLCGYAFAFPKIPNSKFTHPDFCTVNDKDFDGFRYKEKIPHCKRNVSTATRKKVYALYGISWSERGAYTVDHLISLFDAGSNHISNLWPQHKSISSAKLEGKLFRDLRDGKITSREALNKILDFKYNTVKK